MVNERMLFMDKKLSAEKISLSWNRLFNEKKSLNNEQKNNDLLIYLYLNISDIFSQFLMNLILYFKNKMHLKNFFFHKNEKIDLEEVRKTINLICKSLKIKNNFKIKKLSNNFIKIYR